MLIILSNSALAQTPLAIPYQAVARTASGNLISNHLISVRFTIHDGSASGTVVYKERHSPTTNALGLFDVNIGTGTIISGTMAGINWGINSKFLQVELDTSGGNAFIDMGTTQLMSVPYALHAKTVDLDKGKTHFILTGDITNAQADSLIANDVGPNTQFIKVFNTTNLTSLNLSACTQMIKIEIYNNANLTNINLDNITRIYELLNIHDNESLASISLPSLQELDCDFSLIANGAITSINLENLNKIYTKVEIIGNAILTTLNFNDLQSITELGSLNILGDPALTSINLSNLTTVTGVFALTDSNIPSLVLNNLTSTTGFFTIRNTPSLITLNLNNLTSIGGNIFTISSTGITTLNFASLTTFGSTLDISNNLLANINMPVISSILNNSYLFLNSNQLINSSINTLLAKFVSLPIFTSCTISLENQNSGGAPTGQGIIDKNTLISNGNNVTSN
jgi:hypothetical protein